MLRSSADWYAIGIYLSRKCDAMMTAETMMTLLGLAVPVVLLLSAIYTAVQRCNRGR